MNNWLRCRLKQFFLWQKPYLFYTTEWGKIRQADSYHRRNGQYQIAGRRKTISDSWLLYVVDTAEEMVNVAFICSINHRKVARAVRNRYAEHFWPPFGYIGAENIFYGYYSYSGNIHLVILKEIIFWSYNKNYFKTVVRYVSSSWTNTIYFANTQTYT
jgi:hypothetical protein